MRMSIDSMVHARVSAQRCDEIAKSIQENNGGRGVMLFRRTPEGDYEFMVELPDAGASQSSATTTAAGDATTATAAGDATTATAGDATTATAGDALLYSPPPSAATFPVAAMLCGDVVVGAALPPGKEECATLAGKPTRMCACGAEPSWWNHKRGYGDHVRRCPAQRAFLASRDAQRSLRGGAVSARAAKRGTEEQEAAWAQGFEADLQAELDASGGSSDTATTEAFEPAAPHEVRPPPLVFASGSAEPITPTEPFCAEEVPQQAAETEAPVAPSAPAIEYTPPPGSPAIDWGGSWYDILGVEPGVPGRTLQNAFRKLSKRYHTDKGGKHLDFIRLKYVSETLKNPARRAEYDEHGASFFAEGFPKDAEEQPEQAEADDAGSDANDEPDDPNDKEYETAREYFYRECPIAETSIKHWLELLAVRELYHGHRIAIAHKVCSL